jgi:hypothetical protein
MKLGTCESLYEQEPIKQEMCARINVSQIWAVPYVLKFLSLASLI